MGLENDKERRLCARTFVRILYDVELANYQDRHSAPNAPCSSTKRL